MFFVIVIVILIVLGLRPVRRKLAITSRITITRFPSLF